MHFTRAIATVLLAAAAFVGSVAGVAAASPTAGPGVSGAVSSSAQPDDTPWR